MMKLPFLLALLTFLGACETGRAEWSVYFDHITPMPGSPDGGVGAKRRCYCRQDESGNTWDEDTVEVRAPHYRQIRTYNLQGFPAGFEVAQFRVHQRYTALSPTQTRLEFASELLRPDDWWSRVRFITKVREANRVIQLNLENIKVAVEARQSGTAYTRPHPWEPKHVWD